MQAAAEQFVAALMLHLNPDLPPIVRQWLTRTYKLKREGVYEAAGEVCKIEFKTNDWRLEWISK